MFPGAVEVRYYDALAPEMREAHAARLDLFARRHWPYPISLIDGEVVAVGGISVFGLLQAIGRVRWGNGDGRPE